ncbi:MBL fold metallo-hydrolase [Tepidibacter formicigenes]|jgi:phosphoribosyl 1,2-cyclic phosphodiesterase|uniref:Phosphoribosyl 1,2-cyclic phosphodiesterase n=1 Tax=Tepidibacter formicigenes DSM 15518 TaxID=1123349 RepID=A0A1M6NK22_9FIRM|nr:MBL fold metallo-hydrolase [Tepidibacter formicigenes]SHJ96040.1 Phosphoribosyl 1,2-cyclic phosphodiesterase [Tepidibacter formicigenes DSM 15518]
MCFKYASVASGSCGNCHYIGYKNTKILVDAGLSGKKTEENLNNLDINLENTSGILITHEHTDHIKGAGILSRRYNIPIYANENTWKVIENKIGKIKENNIKVFENNVPFYIEDIKINPFSIHHDAADPVAYTFYNGKNKISIATDLGYVCDKIKENIYDSKLVVLESNHDVEMLKMGSYPYYLKKRVLSRKGHLSNEDAGRFCIELVERGTEKILLAHLSRENNFPELAFETVKGVLQEKNIHVGKNLELSVLKRGKISNLYAV